MSTSQYVFLDVALIMRQTANAFLLRLDNGEEHWIPRSQIAPDDESDMKEGQVNLEVPITRWIADQKNIEARDE